MADLRFTWEPVSQGLSRRKMMACNWQEEVIISNGQYDQNDKETAKQATLWENKLDQLDYFPLSGQSVLPSE